jgi:hypothetical protein
MYIHIYTHKYTYIHIYIYTHIHIYTYIHIHIVGGVNHFTYLLPDLRIPIYYYLPLSILSQEGPWTEAVQGLKLGHFVQQVTVF